MIDYLTLSFPASPHLLELRPGHALKVAEVDVGPEGVLQVILQATRLLGVLALLLAQELVEKK